MVQGGAPGDGNVWDEGWELLSPPPGGPPSASAEPDPPRSLSSEEEEATLVAAAAAAASKAAARGPLASKEFSLAKRLLPPIPPA